MRNKAIFTGISLVAILLVVSMTVFAYNEAPVLKKMVEEGILPPVDERLPENPVVVEPIDDIGEYGGTANVYNGVSNNAPFIAIFLMGRNGPFRTDRLGNPGVPNLFKGYDVNEDYTEWTFYLRKGVKWSDGVELTAWNWYDMWKYYWGNDVLTPFISSENVTVEDNAVTFYNEYGQGRTVRKEIIDDYTMKFTCDIPNPTLINRFTNIFGNDSQPIPMHFLKQFHADIIGEKEANAKAKAAGFDDWSQLFHFFNANNAGNMTTCQTRAFAPTLEPYVVVERTQNKVVYERNPYYYKVDPEGNQLPYIDRIVANLVAEREIINGKIITGETDLQAFNLSPQDLPLFKKYEKVGDYTTQIWNNAVNVAVYEFGYSYEDEVVRNLFRQKDFRKALSISIDRDAINEKILFGQGRPGTVTVLPDTKWYEPEFETMNAYYNPEEAREILDSLGVVDRDGDGWREDANGNDIAWVVEHQTGETPLGPVTEMVVSDWQDIGLNVTKRLVEPSLGGARLGTNQMAMWVWHGDGRDSLVFPTFITPAIAPGRMGQSWLTWYNTGGSAGEEPPAEVLEMYETHTKMTYATNEEEVIRLGKKYLRMAAENIYTIGTVNGVPQPFVVKNDLKNFPTAEDFPGEGNPTYLHALFWTNPYEPSQFYFEGRKPIDYYESKLPVLYEQIDKDPVEIARENGWL